MGASPMGAPMMRDTEQTPDEEPVQSPDAREWALLSTAAER